MDFIANTDLPKIEDLLVDKTTEKEISRLLKIRQDFQSILQALQCHDTDFG